MGEKVPFKREPGGKNLEVEGIRKRKASVKWPI